MNRGLDALHPSVPGRALRSIVEASAWTTNSLSKSGTARMREQGLLQVGEGLLSFLLPFHHSAMPLCYQGGNKIEKAKSKASLVVCQP